MPKWVELGYAVRHLDAQAVGIEEGGAVGGVDVLALLHLEGKVLHADLVVAVLAAVGLAETGYWSPKAR